MVQDAKTQSILADIRYRQSVIKLYLDRWMYKIEDKSIEQAFLEARDLLNQVCKLKRDIIHLKNL